MENQATINYERIAEAIHYIRKNFQSQPSIEEIAEHIHLSPTHLNRLFSEWAGISPKKFLQYISVEHAKNILKKNQTSLFNAAFRTGLSSTSRLHDLFINIEGMTPAEYKNGGKNLQIHYSFGESPFGLLIVASTSKGICYMAFDDDKETALIKLENSFPNASFKEKPESLHEDAVKVFQNGWDLPSQLKLHLKGTTFQLKVWETLLKIPMGSLTTYGEIAKHIQSPNASRAVGTAIGSNPVAFLIPCHRVIRTSGEFGGYMWGETRKAAMIGWESKWENKPI